MDQKKPEDDVFQRNFETIKSALRAAPIGIGVVQNRILKQVNRRICDMVGYNEDELLEKAPEFCIPTKTSSSSWDGKSIGKSPNMATAWLRPAGNEKTASSSMCY